MEYWLEVWLLTSNPIFHIYQCIKIQHLYGFCLFSANEDVHVDQRVIDMVRDSYSEDKTISDDIPQRPKSSSFMYRSGSFTTKTSKDKGAAVKKQDADEKEKESARDEKSFQQFNKNVSHFLVN